MSVINTNVSATLTQNAITKNERAMSNAMEQLSTGKRINSASDDAAGLAIAARMTAQIEGLGQAVRNANDAISLIQTADGALTEVTSMLQRMRQLAVQAASDTNTTSDRTALNNEYGLLRTEIDRIADNTQWNGQNVLDGSAGSMGALDFAVGANKDQIIEITIKNFSTDGTAASATAAASNVTNGVSGTAITSVTGANAAITALDTAIDKVNTERSTLGATMNQLQYASDNLLNVKANAEASRSRIEDTDYAAATTELARTQIIQQAATAMLAQANQIPQTVLALLK